MAQLVSWRECESRWAFVVLVIQHYRVGIIGIDRRRRETYRERQQYDQKTENGEFHFERFTRCTFKLALIGRFASQSAAASF